MVEQNTRTFRSKRGAAVAGVLVVAALLGLGRVLQTTRVRLTGPGARPELQELLAALEHEPERPIDSRLSGFSYARTPVQWRGSVEGRRSPEIEIAVARLEKLTRQNDVPTNAAALGAAYLAVGDWDRAVLALEDAVQRDARNATFLNDLAAAYIARAERKDRHEDWVNGLAAANRAIALDPRRPEPYFNRAVAFHGLHLTVEEGEAWSAHQSAESDGPWRTESDERLRAIRLRAGQQIVDDHQAVRERIENTLLGRWGEAVERADRSEADALLSEIERLADSLADSGGDAMARDEVVRIRRLQRAGDTRRLRDLAMGHALYASAQERFAADKQLEASELMSRASEHFRRGDSPYTYAAPVFRAILLRNKGQAQAAMDALKTVTQRTVPQEYPYLRGRLAWIESLLDVSVGRYDLTRDLLTRAVEAFRSAEEADNLVTTLTNLAEAEWFLGNRDRAWANLVDALATIDRRGTTRRIAHFDLAATMSLGAGLPEAAVEFHNALVRVLPKGSALMRAQSYLRRARTLARAGDATGAARDLDRAVDALMALPDKVLIEQTKAEIDITRTELFSQADCQQTISQSGRVLDYLAHTDGTIRRASVLTLRARCRESLGDTASARADLLAAVEAFEARRAHIATATDRLLAFEPERATFKELVAIEEQSGDEEAAFRWAERGRAGVIAEAWNRAPSDLADHHRLPSDVAVVYYESLPDRVLIWVLTREQRVAISQPLGEVSLRRSVNRIVRAIQEGADLKTLRPYSNELFDALIAPALAIADRLVSKSRIVFVPDGPLFALPFGALPDAEGRPLLQTRSVSLAPSLRTFLAASTRLTTFAATDVLAVGDGHDAAATGLPMLRGADREAAEVARLYPKSILLAGADATKRRFLAARAHVIHFGGHTVLNERYPTLSRMLLAPEPRSGDSGWLLGADITAERFRDTDVVVLATCEGAAGKAVEGEGAISVARAFFGAGVPAVIGSLWPVGDDLQTLVQTLHRTLLTQHDAALALRAGQLALLEERGAQTPVRVWGGFMMLGGLSPSPTGEKK